jgi:hypothetical protein
MHTAQFIVLLLGGGRVVGEGGGSIFYWFTVTATQVELTD